MDLVALVLGVGAIAYGLWCVVQGIRSMRSKPPPVESHEPPLEEPPTRTSAAGLMYGMTARYHPGWLLGWGVVVVLIGLFLMHAGLVG